jgi:hypothetical protein
MVHLQTFTEQASAITSKENTEPGTQQFGIDILLGHKKEFPQLDLHNIFLVPIIKPSLTTSGNSRIFTTTQPFILTSVPNKTRRCAHGLRELVCDDQCTCQ